MRKPFNLFVTLIAFALVSPAASFAKGNNSFPPRFDPEISQLRHEIAAVKLDKLLELSRNQASNLLPLLKEAQQIREQQQSQRDGRRQEIIAALTRVRNEIRSNGKVSPSAKEALEKANGNRPFREAHQKIKDLNQKVFALLTVEQQEKLKKFDPRPRSRVGVDNMDAADELDCRRQFQGKHGRRGNKHQQMGFKAGPRYRAAIMIALTPEFQKLLEERAR